MSNIDKQIGFVVLETAAVAEASGKIISDDGRRVTAEVILQDMNVLNRNKRFYSSKEMNPALKNDRLVELLQFGQLFGEEGHPQSKEISRQQIIEPTLRSHKITKLWTSGNDILAHVKGSNTCHGEAFNQDLLDGDKPSFSLRALGTVNQTSRGAEVENITIITWDHVIYPSHKRAYTQRIIGVSEGASLTGGTNEGGNKVLLQENDGGLLIPITNSQVLDYIKEKSSNYHTIKESIDLLYESTQLINEGKQIQLTSKEGDVYVVNLEQHLQDKMYGYSSKIILG